MRPRAFLVHLFTRFFHLAYTLEGQFYLIPQPQLQFLPEFTFLIYGISRSLTHELVRHRAGFGFSQVSQRYVDSKHSKTLRFVERPEYQSDEELHNLFVARIERAAKEYEEKAELLLNKQHDGWKLLSGDKKSDLRKKVNQCARSLLPNETEAPIVVTANIRAWRHFIEQRANERAEIEIRELAVCIFLCFAIGDTFLIA